MAGVEGGGGCADLPWPAKPTHGTKIARNKTSGKSRVFIFVPFLYRPEYSSSPPSLRKSYARRGQLSSTHHRGTVVSPDARNWNQTGDFSIIYASCHEQHFSTEGRFPEAIEKVRSLFRS